MATFDTLIDDLASRFGLGANARSLVREILAMISSSPGGLSGFLDTFKSAGLTSEVASWLGRPDAGPIAAGQVERALGATTLGGIAGRLGLAQGAVSTALGYALPKIVGLLTPGGAIPAGTPAEVTAFLSQSRAAAATGTWSRRCGSTFLRRARRTNPRSGAGFGRRSLRWSSLASFPISGRRSTGCRPLRRSQRRRSLRLSRPQPAQKRRSRRRPRPRPSRKRRLRRRRLRQRRLSRQRRPLPLLRRTRRRPLLRLRRLLRRRKHKRRLRRLRLPRRRKRPPPRLRPRRPDRRPPPRLLRQSQRLNQPRPRPAPRRANSRSATTMASCARQAPCATRTQRPRSSTGSTRSSARTK